MAAALIALPAFAQEKPFTVVEAGIPAMQAALRAGRVTSRELVRQSLDRIATYEDKLHAAITVNPRALEEADALDRERKAGRVRGPLHGIPVALKDNILTTDMPTTGGALAFEGFVPPYEATVTRKTARGGRGDHRQDADDRAGELGGRRRMPNNYNGLTGYGYNPYDPRRDPREATFDGRPALDTGGSSSGAGTAASFWAANVGTETSGSILSPANQNMLAAIKPTVGRISRYGDHPHHRRPGHRRTHGQDRHGRGERSSASSKVPIPTNDPATTSTLPAERRLHPVPQRGRAQGRAHRHPARRLLRQGHAARRDQAARRTEPRAGEGDEGGHRRAEEQGAIVVDPAEHPQHLRPGPGEEPLALGRLQDMDEVKERKCSIVLAYGMERDFNTWLEDVSATRRR